MQLLAGIFRWLILNSSEQQSILIYFILSSHSVSQLFYNPELNKIGTSNVRNILYRDFLRGKITFISFITYITFIYTHLKILRASLFQWDC